MSSDLFVNDSIGDLNGVGSVIQNKFESIGVFSILDLIYYFPRKYIDYSKLVLINDLRPGDVSFKATINKISGRYSKRGLHITEAVAYDQTGSVKLIWFNQPYRKQSVKSDVVYLINGRFGLFSGRLLVNNPSIELMSDFPINSARIIPIYSATKLISSKLIRQTMATVLKNDMQLPESLPDEILDKFGLISLKEALSEVHFPKSFISLEKAKYRIAFDEVLTLFLAAHINKKNLAKAHALKLEPNVELVKDFIKTLQFELTSSQRQIIWRILLDFKKNYPMNRLIEGDVGSGKTIVALIASLNFLINNFQVCFIAPTEILAIQHYHTIVELLKPMKLDHEVILLTGSNSLKQKIVIKEQIYQNKMKFIIGTHALLQEDVKFNNLALIIVDEQHRFGVKQRQIIQSKTVYQPHVLALSATPIPRSLALTLFGELSISRLKDKPLNRYPVKTEVISEDNIELVYQIIRDKVKNKEQVFIVCPAITNENFFRGKSVEFIYQELKNKVFPNFNIDLIHGQLKSKAKNEIMQKFIDRQIDILVSTTVIEVGVDVPNATLMVIFDADQFGLAQIHQLRGRVGRGKKAGLCFLIGDSHIKQNSRIKILEKSNDGFYLAEEDLKIRGAGSIYGENQHGALDLKFAHLDDKELLNKARLASQKIFKLDPELVQYKIIKDKIEKLNNIFLLN